ncbi:MAG: radical SAM protein, partial [Clostridia bacterium]|nr:radical SAM protein [Clostridia bacterium]
MQRLKVGLVSLGCDKNRVDSEKLLYEISKSYDVTSDAGEADVLVINSCAFLNASRKESIDAVFEYVGLKEKGNLKKIILAGCLPQKFVGELFDEFTEVDGFIGTFDGSLIISVIDRTLRGERVNAVGLGKALGKGRIKTTPDHYAYLKIADGCNNFCTYCLIPKIRGKYVSEPIERLIEETKALGEVKELVLVAQDVTRYGEDLYGEIKLVELIRALSALENVGSIRLLYCYPELMSDALIEEFKTNKKLVRYVDIPLQHASDRILKLMNRKGSRGSYLALLDRLQKEI